MSGHRLISVSFKKWCWNLCGFHQFGLLSDDLCHDHESFFVKEALRRLPQEIKDQRNFRIVRAMQLDACKRILPKEQWTKYEEDTRYLKPYIEEVVKEFIEKKRWEWEEE